jgi:hypothetical protein
MLVLVCKHRKKTLNLRKCNRRESFVCTNVSVSGCVRTKTTLLVPFYRCGYLLTSINHSSIHLYQATQQQQTTTITNNNKILSGTSQRPDQSQHERRVRTGSSRRPLVRSHAESPTTNSKSTWESRSGIKATSTTQWHRSVVDSTKSTQ